MRVLFIVYDPTTDKVIYYANGILELFRLRKVYNPPPEGDEGGVQVYRYVAGNVYTDKYFTWNKDTMWWESSHHLTGVGFGNTSFASLEAGYKMLGGK
jgi:hypothetical protein